MVEGFTPPFQPHCFSRKGMPIPKKRMACISGGEFAADGDSMAQFVGHKKNLDLNLDKNNCYKNTATSKYFDTSQPRNTTSHKHR
jgi:hypothetical protein